MVQMTQRELDKLKLRSRQFAFQRNMFFDTHDEKGELVSDLSEEQWKERVISDLEKIDAFEKWLIFHDSDVNDDGTEKGLHCHGILKFKNPKMVSGLCNELTLQSRNVDAIKKDSGAYRYLLHITDNALRAKKHLYSLDELMCWVNNEKMDDMNKREMYSEYCRGKEKDTEKMTQNEIVNEVKYLLNKGDMFYNDVQSYLQMRFGEVDGTLLFLRHTKEFDIAVEERYKKRIADKEKGRRTLDTIYISGGSGIGKTYFADELSEYIARMNNYNEDEFFAHAPAVQENGKFYMLDEYNGEQILTLNDIDGYHLSYDEFKTRFEPTAKKAPSVPNRYKNKKFIADICFITYSKSVYEWAESIISDGCRYESDRDNVRKQVLRRIPYWVELNDSDVKVKKFNQTNLKYETIKTFNKNQAEREEDSEDIFDYIASLTTLYRGKK